MTWKLRSRWHAWGLGAVACAALVAALGLQYLRSLQGSTGLTDEERYLPENCRLIASVNVRALLTNASVKEFIQSPVFARWNRDFGRHHQGLEFDKGIEDYTGLPLADVLRITFFGALSSHDDKEAGLWVVKANGARRFRLKDGLFGSNGGKNASAREEAVDRHTLMVLGGDLAGMASCVVDEETILLGPTSLVRHVMERRRVPEILPGLKKAKQGVDFAQMIAFAADFTDLTPQERARLHRGWWRDAGKDVPGLWDGADHAVAQGTLSAELELAVALQFTDASAASKAKDTLQAGLNKYARKLEKDVNGYSAFAAAIDSFHWSTTDGKVSVAASLAAKSLTEMGREITDWEAKRQRSLVRDSWWMKSLAQPLPGLIGWPKRR